MHYHSNIDLPKDIQNILPEHAQEIYRMAFNHAWDEYRHPNQRPGNESQEDFSRGAAWSAVKSKYTKRGDS